MCNLRVSWVHLDPLYVCVSLIFSGMRLGADSQFSDFLDGLGPGQLVGRQTLATPAMGERWTETCDHVLF